MSREPSGPGEASARSNLQRCALRAGARGACSCSHKPVPGRGALHICKASSKHHLYQQAEAPLLCAQSSATCPFTANLDIHYQPEGAQRLLVRRPTEGRPRVHIGRSRLGRHLGLPRPWTSRLRHRPLLVEGRAGGEQRARPQWCRAPPLPFSCSGSCPLRVAVNS